MQYILAHDFGTSADKASLFTTEGEFIATTSASYPTHYSHGNWAEQDPADWWAAFCACNKTLLQGIDPADVLCVSFDGTHPNCICVDKDLKLIRPVSIWQDARGYKETREISALIPAKYTSSRPNGIFSTDRTLIHLLWVKNNAPEDFARIHKVMPCVTDYIVMRLTGHVVTSYEMGWCTTMMNLDKRTWSEEICTIAGIPMDILPELHERTDIVGEVPASLADECSLQAGTKLVLGTGDSQSTSVGLGILNPGDAYMNGGTSAGIILQDNNGKNNYRQTASSGASLSWLKNTICLHEQSVAEQTGRSIYDIIGEEVAQAPIGSNGVMFHPYMAGERWPRHNPRSKGSFVGLSLTTTRQDLMRSVVEGIGFNLNVILQSFRDEGYDVQRLPIVGGLGNGPVVRQIFADIMNVELVTYKYMDEAANIGAAVLGGIALGIYDDETAYINFTTIDSITRPIAENHAKYQELIPLFEHVYNAQVPVYEKM